MTRFHILFLLFIILISACKTDSSEKVFIDFSKSASDIETKQAQKDSTKVINIAVSAMVSPKVTYKYYNEIFDYIADKLHIKINIKQRRTYSEVNQLLLKNEVDIAFICTGAYKEIKKDVDLFVVPVCYGRPQYQAYVIANTKSSVKTFTDFTGKNFAFTDEISNTGKHYIDTRLKQLGLKEETFFNSTIFTYSHDISIQMVSKNLVDGASVDGLIYEYMAHNDADKVKNINIIEKSDFFGIPPVVSIKNIEPKLKNNIRQVLLNMHKDPKGQQILKKLLIDKFITTTDTLYAE